MRRIAVELIPNNSDRILMALKINGRPATFILATGDSWSLINPKWIGDLTPHLSHTKARLPSESIYYFVRIESLESGPISMGAHDMFVAPDGRFPDGIAGEISASFLQNFDVDLSLSENKLNLFLPSDCDTAPVYWTSEPYVEIPIEEDRWARVFTKVLIDGKRVRTKLSTGNPISTLALSAASNLFDLVPGGEGMEDVSVRRASDAVVIPRYQHRFATLEMGDLLFKNPLILIEENKLADIDKENYDFLLGVHQLRNIHIYISYVHHKLYLTKATAPSTAPTAQ